MKFAPAEPLHDAALRELAASEAMPGWIRLRFTREPSFFDGIAVQGRRHQTAVLLDGECVLGVGCRSIRRVYLDGRAADFGYLGGLRLHPRARSGTALARGYRYFGALHRDGRAPAYLTTIVESNRTALDLLTSGRAGLPAYWPIGRLFSYALPPRRGGRRPDAGVRTGAEIGAAALTAFLAREGPGKQFFPVLDAADFGQPELRDLGLKHFRVLQRQGEIVAVAAVWDQRAFHQVVVAGYAPLLRALRPAANAFLRLAGFPTLPKPGAPLRLAYLAFVCVKDNDPAVFRALLGAIRAETADTDLHLLCVGLHEDDGLNAALRGIPRLRYTSRVFVVEWDGARPVARERIPYVEAATL